MHLCEQLRLKGLGPTKAGREVSHQKPRLHLGVHISYLESCMALSTKAVYAFIL